MKPIQTTIRETLASLSNGRFSQLVLLILFACSVVAVSARGMRLLVPPVALVGSWVWGIRMFGVAAAVAGLVVLISQRPRRRTGRARSPSPTLGALRRAATIMGLLTLLALLVQPPIGQADALRGGPLSPRETSSNREPGTGTSPQPDTPGGRGGGGGSGGGGGAGGPARPVPVAPSPQPELSLFQKLAGNLPLNILLIVGVICLFVLMRRRKRRLEPDPFGTPLAPEDAEAGLEASLAEVAGEAGDPREQVTSAYLRLLAALAAAGAPRLVQEAPHEHLHRTLGPLGVHPEPLHQLADLYVMAQFSERSVLDRHRARAAQALEVSLADLRRTVDSRRGGGLQRVPAEARA